MISLTVRNVLEKLNKYNQLLLEGAVGACVSRGQYEVTAAHLLAQAYEEGNGDLPYILSFFKVDPGLFKIAVQKELKELKTGNTGKPVFSPILLNALELAWSECSLNLNRNEIRSGGLVLALRKNLGLCGAEIKDQLALIQPEVLSAKFDEIVSGSKESMGAGATKRKADGKASGDSFLERFTINFVEMAKEGKIDPIFGRDGFYTRRFPDPVGLRYQIFSNNSYCISRI